MRVLAPFVLVGLLGGCGPTETFTCVADAECVDGEKSGVCEPSGFCSFPDPTCPSGKRHGEYAGAGLAGTCVESMECADPCGPCETCENGTCAVVAPDTPCTVECGDFVSGLEMDGETRRCLAFARGPGEGSCDAGGQCVPGPDECSLKGETIAECAAACGRDDHNCVAWAPVETIGPETLCATMAETPSCQSSCVDGGNGEASTLTPRRCDAWGQCVAEAATTCGGYVCDGNACATSCKKKMDCVGTTKCDMASGTCQ